jgi:hypothetical protein
MNCTFLGIFNILKLKNLEKWIFNLENCDVSEGLQIVLTKI